MTPAVKLKKIFEEIDVNSLSDKELNELYVEVRSKTVELNRVINTRKHLKFRHPSKDNKTE